MKEYKDKYDLGLFTEEIKALTGKELENYIIALSNYDRIYLDDEYFSKLMKYGKKTEVKKILNKHNIKPEKTEKYKGGKESYEMHPSIGEIKKLTGEDLENYIEALMKFNMIEKDNPAFEKLMKYGKKRELKEILGRLGIKNPAQTEKVIKNSAQTAKIDEDDKIEYGLLKYKWEAIWTVGSILLLFSSMSDNYPSPTIFFILFFILLPMFLMGLIALTNEGDWAWTETEKWPWKRRFFYLGAFWIATTFVILTDGYDYKPSDSTSDEWTCYEVYGEKKCYRDSDGDGIPDQEF